MSRFCFHGKTLFLDKNRNDAFNAKVTSQYSLAYEKACTLFNLASVCAAIGASQNRFEASGLKMAFNYCQVSAGMFKFINENFLHPPSADLGRESILVLSNLMLMQAQECFIEKTIQEKKKSMMISKLAAHVAHGYSGLVDDMNHAKVKTLYDPIWAEVMKVSFLSFLCLGQIQILLGIGPLS
jgi:hypothetical protein